MCILLLCVGSLKLHLVCKTLVLYTILVYSFVSYIAMYQNYFRCQITSSYHTAFMDPAPNLIYMIMCFVRKLCTYFCILRRKAAYIMLNI